MAKSGKPASGPKQTIEELQARFAELDKRRIQVATQLEGARKQLEELRQQAREQFETDDLNELKQKLEALRAENEKKRAAYQASLDAIDRQLAEIDSANEDTSSS